MADSYIPTGESALESADSVLESADLALETADSALESVKSELELDDSSANSNVDSPKIGVWVCALNRQQSICPFWCGCSILRTNMALLRPCIHTINYFKADFMAYLII